MKFRKMIECIVISAKETRVYKKVRSVSLPAVLGQMQILSGHAEAFIQLRKGSIRLRKSNNQYEDAAITGGECHVYNNRVKVIL